MRPETKKGMFANGKSSKSGIINLLESTKATSKLIKLLGGAQANERPEGILFPINAWEAYDGITRNER